MNLYRINLNLLKVFSVLMREQHVSLAAECLHLTQPAISNSLQQLRDLFQDELLIRGPKKMVPTQKALLLAPKIEHVLRQLETVVFYSDVFDYQTSTRTFTLGMTDYAEYVLLPKLYERIRSMAPNISLRILNYHEFLPEYFENEQLELGIGLEKKRAKPLVSERIFSDDPVCVARQGHEIFKKPLTLKRYLAAEHLNTCIQGDGVSRADKALKKLQVARHVKLTMTNALPAFQLLATSDLVGTFSGNIVQLAEQRYPLQHAKPPFAIPTIHIVQLWHRQQANDSGLLWLRTLINDICRHNFKQ